MNGPSARWVIYDQATGVIASALAGAGSILSMNTPAGHSAVLSSDAIRGMRIDVADPLTPMVPQLSASVSVPSLVLANVDFAVLLRVAGSVRVVDATGALVYQKRADAGEHVLRLSTTGSYTVIVRAAGHLKTRDALTVE